MTGINGSTSGLSIYTYQRIIYVPGPADFLRRTNENEKWKARKAHKKRYSTKVSQTKVSCKRCLRLSAVRYFVVVFFNRILFGCLLCLSHFRNMLHIHHT